MATIGNVIGNTLGIIFKKPFIIIFWGIIMLIITLTGYLLPVFETIIKLGYISGSNVFDTILSFIQVAYSYLSYPKAIAIFSAVIILFLFSVSIIGGAIMSGFFFVLNNAVNKKATKKDGFSYGLKKYFYKISFMNFIVLFIGTVLISVMMVASVPAIVITRASATKGIEGLSSVLFIDVLTGTVLFLGLMFYRIYTFFWYPAVLNGVKKPFKSAKNIANTKFWEIVFVFLVFDFINIALQIMFIKYNDNIPMITLKWILSSAFYAVFTTYIFTAYNKYTK